MENDTFMELLNDWINLAFACECDGNPAGREEAVKAAKELCEDAGVVAVYPLEYAQAA